MFSTEYLTIDLLKIEKIIKDVEITLIYDKEVLKDFDLGNFFHYIKTILRRII